MIYRYLRDVKNCILLFFVVSKRQFNSENLLKLGGIRIGSRKDKFRRFCEITCFGLFDYFVCRIIQCSKRISFFADLEYCSLLLLSFVGKFFSFHENYSLFDKEVICRCFENKSDYSWLCFKIILGCFWKLFFVALKASRTILRVLRKLFFVHMKTYLPTLFLKVPAYLCIKVDAKYYFDTL